MIRTGCVGLGVLTLLAGCTGDSPSQPGADAAPSGDAGSVPDGAAADAATSNVIPSAGCRSGAGLSEGEQQFSHEGMDRRYVVRLPAGYTRDRAWPLLFALHPNGSDATYWDGQGGDRDVRAAVANEAVLIVTEAIGGNWRDYGMPEASWPARLETELRYFDAIYGVATDELCIDEAAIYAMGFSGGGSFSGVLGCQRNYIAGFAAGGSVIYFDSADCVGSPPAWITIGELEMSAGRAAYRDHFRDGAGCAATAAPTTPAPCVAYDGCGEQTPVHYCEHAGDHVWPDFGTAAAWDFLRALHQ